MQNISLVPKVWSFQSSIQKCLKDRPQGTQSNSSKVPPGGKKCEKIKNRLGLTHFCVSSIFENFYREAARFNISLPKLILFLTFLNHFYNLLLRLIQGKLLPLIHSIGISSSHSTEQGEKKHCCKKTLVTFEEEPQCY